MTVRSVILDEQRLTNAIDLCVAVPSKQYRCIFVFLILRFVLSGDGWSVDDHGREGGQPTPGLVQHRYRQG